jgi:hypothetical protein
MKFSLFHNDKYVTSFKTRDRAEEWLGLSAKAGSRIDGYEIKEEPTYLELSERVRQLEAQLEISGCENCNPLLRAS